MAQVDPQKIISRLAMVNANQTVQIAGLSVELEDAYALLTEARERIVELEGAAAPDGH